MKLESAFARLLALPLKDWQVEGLLPVRDELFQIRLADATDRVDICTRAATRSVACSVS